MTNRVRKAIFPVGGMGTRFLPATKAMPKEMLPVVDRPLIQYAVDEARAAGIEQFIFVTGRGKSAIEDHFDRSVELEASLAEKEKFAKLDDIRESLFEPGNIAYVRQQEPLGLGHAVWCARHLVGNEPFAVLLADDLIKAETPCLRQMVDVFETEGGNVIAAMEVPYEQTSRYGIIDSDEADGRVRAVTGLVEKPARGTAPSNLAVIGRYILTPTVFDELERGETGAGGEIQLTDAMARLIGRQPFHGLAFEGRRFDCGDKLGFLEANLAFALGREDLGPGARELLARMGEGSE
ncbi:MAG: UTP--glucose-1-phosphate uridylyltransferase [Rhodospirillaceae bacterium]|nr:UTP--glucose-1-phosphate uridylyltransferase [Rhodospirillaceae bacterium]